MIKPDYSRRFVWLSAAVIAGLAALWYVPSFELFGMSVERVDILSQLRPQQQNAPEMVEYSANIERLEQELAVHDAVMRGEDTLINPTPLCYEWIVKKAESAKREKLHSESLAFDSSDVVRVEDFDTLATTRFDDFIDKLASGEEVRIAFMGDSFVEGDILTSDLRDILQRKLGGRGVGFVSADIPFATVRKSVKRSSAGWKTYSVMKPKEEAPEALRDKFFVSGYLADGRPGATTTWTTTDAFSTLDSCSRARIMFISRDSSRVEVAVNDSLVREFEIVGDSLVRQIYVEAPISKLRVKVLEGGVLCYGASLEGDGGVLVDNYSVRSNNGHAIFGTSATVNRQMDDALSYDLVVLQYGLNIMQQGQRGYSRYRDQLSDMITYAERCFPGAAVLVLGVSDRWVKNADTGVYESIGSVDALTSYQRAAADSCNVTFWNTSKVMMNLGGMPAFVRNGWAAKDYTHINFAGGRRIAQALGDAFCLAVYERLVEREEAEYIEAIRALEAIEAEERRKAQEQQRLDTMIEIISPILEGQSTNEDATSDAIE